MTKQTYFVELEKELIKANFSQDEREEILAEIRERFSVAKEKKQTISYVIDQLGTPQALVASYINSDEEEKKTPNNRRERSALEVVVVTLIVVGLNGLFVVWVILAAYCLILGLIAGGGGVMLAGLIVAAVPALSSLLSFSLPLVAAPVIVMMGVTLALAALTGILIMVQILIWMIKLTGKYFKFNLAVLKGEI